VGFEKRLVLARFNGFTRVRTEDYLIRTHAQTHAYNTNISTRTFDTRKVGHLLCSTGACWYARTIECHFHVDVGATLASIDIDGVVATRQGDGRVNNTSTTGAI
jgi:hypothetical protein